MSQLSGEFASFLKDHEACVGVAQGICARHHLAFNGVRVHAGSHLLFAIGDTLTSFIIYKIFPLSKGGKHDYTRH